METGRRQPGTVQTGRENIEIYEFIDGTEKIIAFPLKIIL